MNEKLSFMAEGFFKKQYEMKWEPTHRRGFYDLIEDLEEKAHIMKSQGLTSKPASSRKEKNWVKMAPAQVSNRPKTFSDVVPKSPPKAQQPLQVKVKCEFCRRIVQHFWQQKPFKRDKIWQRRRASASDA